MEEVKVGIDDLNLEGALRPDGLPVYFFNEFLAAVESNVMSNVDEFWSSGCAMDRLN